MLEFAEPVTNVRIHQASLRRLNVEPNYNIGVQVPGAGTTWSRVDVERAVSHDNGTSHLQVPRDAQWMDFAFEHPVQRMELSAASGARDLHLVGVAFFN